MTRPIQAGDVCIVVGGFTRANSPNKGKVVTVKNRVYGAHGADHSQFGAMYHCAGEGICQLDDNGEFKVTGEADFAGIWLQRIGPELLKKYLETKKELEDV